MHSLLSVAQRTPQSNKGFTFIELMIGIGITLILFAVGSFYLIGVRNNTRLESESQSLIVILRAAQEKAAGQQDDGRWGVFIQNPASGVATYTLYRVDEIALAAGPPYSIAPGTVAETRRLPAGISFNLPAVGDTVNVLFGKGTGLPTETTTLILRPEQDENLTRSISIADNGRIE